ncbi:unnamed protein product, partial [Strongylus vulgaris]
EYDNDDFGAPDVDDYYEPSPSLASCTPAPNENAKEMIGNTESEERELKKEMEEMEVEPVHKEVEGKPPVQTMLLAAEWDDTKETCSEPTVEVTAGSEAFYVKEDGQQMIRMYWLDAFEDPVKHSGTVYLFGRVNVSGSKWASCCVTIKNIFRQVFFLPRETQAKKHFMHDGTISEDHCADEIKVIEVQYESSYPKLPTDLSGETFSAVFNTTTTAMERLLVEKAMMGPGWIDISNYTEVTAKQSYCDYEFSVDMERMRNLTYNTSITQNPPPVRMLVLNVLTTLNEKKENEICMISTLYNPACSLSNPSTDQKDLHRLCMFTKPCGGTLPFDIKDQLNRRGLADIVLTAGNEKALLSLFLAKIHKYEPDIIVVSYFGVIRVDAILPVFSSQQLLNLIQWSWMDPWLSLRVIAQINALQLAVQITNIVGGVTSRTLMGGRAERNEFLLLHAFNKANYIAPNKYQTSFKKGNQEKFAKNEDDEITEENETEVKSKNKAQYSGGLVLEPKKGELSDSQLI